jgi:hypothetical protein
MSAVSLRTRCDRVRFASIAPPNGSTAPQSSPGATLESEERSLNGMTLTAMKNRTFHGLFAFTESGRV